MRSKKAETPAPDEGLRVGYARVSTDDQTLDPQIADLLKAGCDPHHIHTDKRSGVSKRRPGLAMLWKDVREGDTVVVTSIDRFGRSTMDLLQNLKRLDDMGVHFESIKERVDTKTAIGRFVFTLLASLAELERNWIAERTRRTMRHKIEQGARYGRDFLLSEAERKRLRAERKAGETVSDLAKRYGVSRATVRNYLRG